MSLHKFAEQVAAHGRGDDSLLVHMTPDEVQRLQKFAEANGRSLTINPHTGLPEAGFLSDLFKAVAPIALGAFLGPAGAAFGGGFMSAGAAGLLTGGITTLATGSLSRGLMAGLGAYGGANLGSSVMGAGEAAVDAGATAAAQGQLGAANLALGEAMPEQAAKQFTQDAVSRQVAAATPFDKMGAGLGAITSSPEAAGTFAKDNWKSLAAASAPIMAGAMVPTTTTMPKADTNPAYIRQKLYDPYTQTYKSLAPVKASEWGGRSFSDAYTNPQTGEMATLQPRQTSPMAAGGIVALAGGGVPGYATGGAPTMLSDEQLYQKTGSWEAAAAARDAQNNALNAYNWNQAQQAQNPALISQSMNNAQHTQDALEAAKNYVASAATPTTTTDQFVKGSFDAGIGLTEQMQTALANSGLSAAAQYALTHADIGSPLNAEETYGGLKGLSSNINYVTSGLQNQIGAGKLTGQNAREQALTEMNKYGINDADIFRATGKTLKELFPDTVVKPTTVIPGGYYGNATTGVAETTTPGDIHTNPDGTVTVTPNIPGRPDGGFTGMGQVKDVYTAGGGSTGYVSRAPKTIDEFNQLYNKQTGDSLAAYDYLMGKGGGKYPTQSVAANTATGIQRPYWSAGVKYKPKFLSYDKDGNVVSSTTSGTAGTGTTTGTSSLTAAKTINVLNNQGQTETATLSSDGNYYTSGGDAYDVTGKQVQAKAEGGMTGYAMGGGLGSLGSYSDGGRLLKGPGDGVSDSIPATIGQKQQPARLADGEFVVPARIVSELGNGSTEAGAKKLYAMMDRVQKARGKTTGKNKVAANSRADKYLPA